MGHALTMTDVWPINPAGHMGRDRWSLQDIPTLQTLPVTRNRPAAAQHHDAPLACPCSSALGASSLHFILAAFCFGVLSPCLPFFCGVWARIANTLCKGKHDGTANGGCHLQDAGPNKFPAPDSAARMAGACACVHADRTGRKGGCRPMLQRWLSWTRRAFENWPRHSQ